MMMVLRQFLPSLGDQREPRVVGSKTLFHVARVFASLTTLMAFTTTLKITESEIYLCTHTRIIEKNLSEVKFFDKRASLAQKNKTAQKGIPPFVTEYQ